MFRLLSGGCSGEGPPIRSEMPQLAPPSESPLAAPPRAPVLAWWFPYMLAWCVFAAVEHGAVSAEGTASPSPAEWLLGADDRLVCLLLLVGAPLVWWLSGFRILRRGNPLKWLAHLLAGFCQALARPLSG